MLSKISVQAARINRCTNVRLSRDLQNSAVVLPLERLKIRKVVGPAFCERRDMTDFPTEVGQSFAMRAILHPGTKRVAAIEVSVVPVRDFTFRPHAQL